MLDFQHIKTRLFPKYFECAKGISEKFNALKEAEISGENFSFYTSVSSVFSSRIEGEEIDLDSFIKHKKFGVEFQPDYTKKTDDLYEAYHFAKINNLSEKNLLIAHKILTKNILSPNFQGVYRISNMYVLAGDGKIEYVAASPFEIKNEMKNFFSELEILLQQSLNIEEIFFFAALLHLVFVKIHPMNDGNGRLARLLEKWFLAEKLGEKAWFLQSERYDYENHQKYYENVRKLGIEFETLDYEKSLDFLLMLPKSLELS
ncbi:MAG: Fic family protein [Flavobacteriaceae bacterium]|jgi:Fic family protein|nr:Fic family protein [Flavobacteriaceae bacterium]